MHSHAYGWHRSSVHPLLYHLKHFFFVVKLQWLVLWSLFKLTLHGLIFSLLNDIHTLPFKSLKSWIEYSKEPHLLEIDFICNITNVFTVIFAQLNPSLLNKVYLKTSNFWTLVYVIKYNAYFIIACSCYMLYYFCSY